MSNTKYAIAVLIVLMMFCGCSKSRRSRTFFIPSDNTSDTGDRSPDAPSDAINLGDLNENDSITVEEFIFPAHDIDWYVLNVVVPGRVKITLTPPSGQDYDMHVLNDKMQTLAFSGNFGAGKEVVNLNNYSGLLYINIEGANDNNDPENPYILTITHKNLNDG